ncbi:MAG: lantibiotic dehydratase, partial [Acidobacteriota bacterium]
MTLSGRLFPLYVCRIAGLPVGSLEAQQATASATLCNAIDELERQMTERRETLTEGLFATVSGVDDRKKRGWILQVKRDVHNLRRLRPGQLRKLDGLVPEALVRDLQSFLELGGARRQHQDELERGFGRELANARRSFRRTLRDADFQKGLLLSSQSLHGAFERYTRTPVDRLGSKERQIERGLMRYLSRTAMKATPFGTLCAIAAGELDDDATSNGWYFAGDPRRKHSAIRLNKSLYGNLVRQLLRRPKIRRHFHIELNPTLADEDGRWMFLGNVNGKEVFQRLKPNPVVELLRQAFDETPHQPLHRLIEWAASRPELDADEESIEAYVIRLLEIGFLRFRIGIREQEVDWDRPFRAILDAIDDDEARELSDYLRRLREQSEAYSSAPVDQRTELLDETRELTRTSFAKVNAPLGHLANLPFYEDAGSAARSHLPRRDLEAAVAPLIEWIRLTSRLAWPRSEQATARHFFDTFYGPDDRAVPLLRFYEDFYREHFKQHLEHQRPQNHGGGKANDEEIAEKEEYNLNNPFELDLIEGIRNAGTALTERLQELWRADPRAESVNLTRADLESIVADVPEATVPCRSASAFVQYLPGFGPEGRGGLVGSIYHNGFGKYFSRFLYLMPDEVRQQLFENNEDLTDHHLAEICGDGAFNGNLHPPLLPWEVSYPTGESGPSQAQLRSSEILVTRAPDDPNALCLLHRGTAKQILPVDLGFLNSQMRPPLYQLLSRFTPPASFIPQIPEASETPEPPPTADSETQEAQGAPEAKEAQEAQDAPEAQQEAASVPPDHVFYRPRLTFEGLLVLGRRLWIVPAPAFPSPHGDETPARFFLRIQRWRSAHGIPSQVFLQVRPLPPFQAPAEDPPATTRGEPAQADTASAETEADGATEPTAKAAAKDTATAAESATEPAAETAREADAETAADTDTETGERHQGQAGKAGPALRSDLYKPQFIDFHNPLLLDLFTKAPGPLENFVIVLSERLPAKEHLPSHGEDHFATELGRCSLAGSRSERTMTKFSKGPGALVKRSSSRGLWKSM